MQCEVVYCQVSRWGQTRTLTDIHTGHLQHGQAIGKAVKRGLDFYFDHYFPRNTIRLLTEH